MSVEQRSTHDLEREHWKELQQWLIETLIEPVFFEWLKYSLLKGHIKKKNGSSVSQTEYA